MESRTADPATVYGVLLPRERTPAMILGPICRCWDRRRARSKRLLAPPSRVAVPRCGNPLLRPSLSELGTTLGTKRICATLSKKPLHQAISRLAVPNHRPFLGLSRRRPRVRVPSLPLRTPYAFASRGPRTSDLLTCDGSKLAASLVLRPPSCSAYDALKLVAFGPRPAAPGSRVRVPSLPFSQSRRVSCCRRCWRPRAQARLSTVRAPT